MLAGEKTETFTEGKSMREICIYKKFSATKFTYSLILYLYASVTEENVFI